MISHVAVDGTVLGVFEGFDEGSVLRVSVGFDDGESLGVFVTINDGAILGVIVLNGVMVEAWDEVRIQMVQYL